MTEKDFLAGRREFLFLYDIKMGNPNGDPDENRPRVLPDGTHYVTDVRLKRFVRDYLKLKRKDILVDNIEGKTTNLTGRVINYLKTNKKESLEGKALVDILLNAFIDARLFGSSFAFKPGKMGDKDWDPKPEPKTLTGAVQIHMGEVLHRAEEVDILGTSIFASSEEKTQGTFTSYYGLRYALIGFSGIGNEHSAKLSRLTNKDYDDFLAAMWLGIRSSGNTRTKLGQIPHFLLSVEYKTGEEFQFGRLHDYISLVGINEKESKTWSSPADYMVNPLKLITRLEEQKNRIERIRFDVSSDISFTDKLPDTWNRINIEDYKI
jgi:CRISPR-associated protein Csh2